MRASFFIIPVFLSLILVSGSLADDVAISATVDRNEVSVGDDILFTIHVQGTQAIAAPKLPELKGFTSRYLGPNTQLQIVNNQSSVYVGHRYYLRK